MPNWVVSLAGPRRVSLEPCPADPLGPGQVRVRTCYSGISAGTELTLYRGSNPRLSKDWDDATRMFVPRQAPAAYPVTGFGYEEVGEIVEVAADVADRRPGQVVWGIWGHRAEAVLPAAAVQPLAPGLDPLTAVFARPGAIALTAVLAGDLHLGDWVGVFGQGVIGLLGTRLAALSGARVVAVDRVPARLDFATRFGARRVVDAAVDSAAAVLRAATDGRGGTSAWSCPGRTRRCTRRSAPPPTPAASWPPASTRGTPSGWDSARSSTTTGSSWWRPRSPGRPRHPARPAGGPDPDRPHLHGPGGRGQRRPAAAGEPRRRRGRGGRRPRAARPR